jgi:guanylate kinase
MEQTEENILLILSSPSGAGKTTLTKKIQQKYQNFKISVSHTTRLPRVNEIDGVDYYFVSKQKFQDLVEKDSFYEHAKIYDNYYGTSKKEVNSIIKNNDIIFDIDWQGTRQLSNIKNLNLVKIYLTTRNREDLKKRLIKRNQNSLKEVNKRFNSYNDDVKKWNEYDYVVVNDNLEVCFKQIEKIILIEKTKFSPHFV